MSPEDSKTHWPHAPLHKFDTRGTYMVTAGTYQKELLFKAPLYLDLLQNSLLTLTHRYKWHLQAWAIFANHYHFIATSPENASSLQALITELHSTTARTINQIDQTPGRQVWYQFWDSHITYQTSYLARLRYVHQNPVKHRMVNLAKDYPWCSAKWFEENANPAFQKSLSRFKIDSIELYDEF